jgi:hypothetical protein
MILELISDFIDRKIDRHGMNELIQYCVKTACSYINQHNISLRFLNRKIDNGDLAIDIIADLFTRRENSDDYILLHTLKNWQPRPQTESQAAFVLQRIIWNRSEQHICQLLKDNDPYFTKLLKYLNYQIKLNGFFKINHFGTIYIIKPERLPVASPLLDFESFTELPGSLFENKKPKLLKALFDYLEEHREYYPAIPLNLLIKRLQKLNGSENYSQDMPVNELDQLQFNNLIECSLQIVRKHLKQSYIKCGKISQEAGESLKKALLNMCVDLKDGGIQRGLYDYLHAQLPYLDKKEFYRNYRNIFDYLFRILRQEIHKELIS